MLSSGKWPSSSQFGRGVDARYLSVACSCESLSKTSCVHEVRLLAMALSYLYIVVCAPCHESIRVEGVLCKLNGRISPPTKIIVRLYEFLRVGVHSSDVLYDIGNVRPYLGA